MFAKKSGFTLVEVLIASMISAFIMLVAVGALKAVSVSSNMVDSNLDMTSELRFAAKRLSTDLINIYRDKNVENTKLIGSIEETDAGPFCVLTFYTVGRAKARPSQPEGDVYEVEYLLASNEEKSVFMRRLWPNPDKESEPGGILSVIAEDIGIFAVRYFDGREWQMQWPEEMRAFPDLVEVTLTAKVPEGELPVVESFIINLARAALESDTREGERQQGKDETRGSETRNEESNRE